MSTKIYSVFPACGKTWLCEHQEEYGLKILDSDSSYFSWVWECPDDERGVYSPNARKTKKRNPSFPQNYIDHIKCKVESGKYDYIFVSSHASVREALDAAGIDFTIVYPSADLMTEWIGRCFVREKKGERGCNPEVLYDNWYQWLSECKDTGNTHDEIVLCHGEYFSDRLLCNGGFTAFKYENDGITVEDLATYDTAKDAIAFAKLHDWDEVVNDISGEVVWKWENGGLYASSKYHLGC